MRFLELATVRLSVILPAMLFLVHAVGYAAPAQAQMLIAVVGDSHVAGKGVSPGEAYPAKLQIALQARGHNVRVHNGGQNGDTTAGVLARLDSAAPQGTQVAVIWVGINDKKAGADNAAVQAGRQAIASRLKARGVEVVTLHGPSFNDLFSNPATAFPDRHLNSAGYGKVVARSLGQVEAAIKRAKAKGKGV